MRRRVLVVGIMTMMWAPLQGVAPPASAAVDCAFEDTNDNGVFDPSDIVVPDAQWLGGTQYNAHHPFVVPVGCDHTLTTVPAPLYGVKVVAPKITFNGKLQSLPPGGRGVVLVADPSVVPGPPPPEHDGSITIGDGTSEAVISAGGANTLLTTLPAVPRKSVALQSTGSCSITNARLEGNRPLQTTGVGILCTGDIVLRQATITGSRVNIQSLAGKIDGRGLPSGPGVGLAQLCDDPATNLTGNGNLNSVMDAADFPCSPAFASLPAMTFQTPTALFAFCQVVVDPVAANQIRALSEALIMISKNDLDLSSSSLIPNEILGHLRVVLVADDGDVDVSNSRLGGSTTGGSWVFAGPAAVNRTPVDHEDTFGPCSGTLTVANACFMGPVRVCAANIIGQPAPPPCTQRPFTTVLFGNF